MEAEYKQLTSLLPAYIHTLKKDHQPGGVRGRGVYRLRTQSSFTLILILILLPASCVISGKLFNLSVSCPGRGPRTNIQCQPAYVYSKCECTSRLAGVYGRHLHTGNSCGSHTLPLQSCSVNLVTSIIHSMNKHVSSTYKVADPMRREA